MLTHNSQLTQVKPMKSTLCLLLLILCSLRQFLSSSFPDESLPTKSGYLSVIPNSNSAIFYTFYESQNSPLPLSKTPILIWLQGGPGCSSMIGNFLELGPFRVTQNLTLHRNPGSWNRIFGLIFIDNPIGVGFSIADKPEHIPTDQHSVAHHLFVAITKFVESDPIFKNRPIYISGESYAGKYVPAIGYYTLKKNMKLPESKRVNLKGVAIGNGLTDPITQVKTHAASAYFSGLINERQKCELEEAQLKAVEMVKLQKWEEATDARSRVLNMLQNMTGLATLYDYTKKTDYKFSWVTKLLRSVEVKRAIGANESIVFEECSDAVGDALHGDVMKSVKYMVEFLVENSKVLLYQGMFDLRDGVVSTEAWVKTMRWKGIRGFGMAERRVWKVKGEIAGYVQKWGSLSNVVVAGAGHLVPTDQNMNSQAMIEDWVMDNGIFAYGYKQDRENERFSSSDK